MSRGAYRFPVRGRKVLCPSLQNLRFEKLIEMALRRSSLRPQRMTAPTPAKRLTETGTAPPPSLISRQSAQHDRSMPLLAPTHAVSKNSRNHRRRSPQPPHVIPSIQVSARLPPGHTSSRIQGLANRGRISGKRNEAFRKAFGELRCPIARQTRDTGNLIRRWLTGSRGARLQNRFHNTISKVCSQQAALFWGISVDEKAGIREQ